MLTITELALLNTTISLPELSIGQAMDVAEIAERYNEKRLSALIAHLTNDTQLPKYITVQERYYILLNHLSIADNKYSPAANSYQEYFLHVDKPPSDYTEMGLTVNHLLGRHVELLEAQCQNAYDWACGQIALQVSGDFNDLLGVDWTWESLDKDALENMTDDQLNKHLQDRFLQIGGCKDKDMPGLSGYQFNLLADVHHNGCGKLRHLIDTGLDNQGITLIGGEGETPARFRALAHLRGFADELARCVAT